MEVPMRKIKSKKYSHVPADLALVFVSLNPFWYFRSTPGHRSNLILSLITFFILISSQNLLNLFSPAESLVFCFQTHCKYSNWIFFLNSVNEPRVKEFSLFSGRVRIISEVFDSCYCLYHSLIIDKFEI